MRPVVLLTLDRRDGGPGPTTPRVRPRRPEVWVGQAYVDAVVRAGGLPLLVPPAPLDAAELLGLADALVLTGGHFDIHPSLYGETVDGRLDRVEPARTALELDLARLALERGVPVLGVCGGHQALAVAAGGTLVQDLPPDPTHEQPTDPATPWHGVDLEGVLARVLGPAIRVNSTHHQAVRGAGSLTVAGRSPDGVCEALWASDHPWAVGVQWHPELLGDLRLYDALVTAARQRSS